MKFYVYVYRDPRPTKNNQPVYVGKGTGDRDASHQWGSHNKPLQDFLSHLKQAGLEPSFSRVFETDDEQAAFAKEIELIAQYGRRDLRLGPLFNLTQGGEGGSGRVVSDKERGQMRYFSTEHWKDPVYRAKVTARQVQGNARPEVKAKRSKNSIALWDQQGVSLAAKIGAARSTEDSKAKTSAQATAQWADPEYRAKMEAIKKEVDARPEVSEARSSKLKAKWDDPAERAQRQAAMKAAAKSKYRPVHVMPEDKTYESGTAMRAATGMVSSTMNILLKGGEMKQGKFKGWTVRYI